MGSNTLTLKSIKPPKPVEQLTDRQLGEAVQKIESEVLGQAKISPAGPPPIGHNNPPAPDVIPTAAPGPTRKHTKPERAKAKARWWGIIRIPRDDAYHGRPIFRHPTRETAESEAGYLSELQPGVLFVVIEAVSWHQTEKVAA